MPDELNSAFSQALGRYRDARSEYVSLYKKATPVDPAKVNERDRELTRLRQKLAVAAKPLEPFGVDWKADLKELGAG